MAPHHTVFRRSDEVVLSSTEVRLLIALLVLVIISLLSLIALFFLRRYRKSKDAARLRPNKGALPKSKSKHRRPTITTSQVDMASKSVFVYQEKQQLLRSTSSPPSSPLPEIRITFPEDTDDTGKHQSGRVVVVHVGENGEVGLGPVQEEALPAYSRNVPAGFQSLDLDSIGGLKEKDMRP